MYLLKYFLYRLDATLHMVFNPSFLSDIIQNNLPFAIIQTGEVKLCLRNPVEDEHTIDPKMYVVFVDYLASLPEPVLKAVINAADSVPDDVH